MLVVHWGGGSQGVQKKYQEFGSGMPAEHRRVVDVTQGGKRQEAARQPQGLTPSMPGRTGESGGLWEAHGVQNLKIQN